MYKIHKKSKLKIIPFLTILVYVFPKTPRSFEKFSHFPRSLVFKLLVIGF